MLKFPSHNAIFTQVMGVCIWRTALLRHLGFILLYPLYPLFAYRKLNLIYFHIYDYHINIASLYLTWSRKMYSFITLTEVLLFKYKVNYLCNPMSCVCGGIVESSLIHRSEVAKSVTRCIMKSYARHYVQRMNQPSINHVLRRRH